jgi:hypothetical protein
MLGEPEITVNVFAWNEVETTTRTLDEIRDVLVGMKDRKSVV